MDDGVIVSGRHPTIDCPLYPLMAPSLRHLGRATLKSAILVAAIPEQKKELLLCADTTAEAEVGLSAVDPPITDPCRRDRAPPSFW